MNPKIFWKYVQEQTKYNSGINTLKKEDGTLAVADHEKAATLNKFFSSVFVEENLSNVPLLGRGSKSNGCTITDIVITPDMVEKKLKELNPSKTEGSDCIPPRVLQELCNELAEPLCTLFTFSPYIRYCTTRLANRRGTRYF